MQERLGRMVYKKGARDRVEHFLLGLEKEYIMSQRGDAALWVAIVREAWTDAFYPQRVMPGNNSMNAARLAHREAKIFLFGGFRWREYRILCCDNAGIDPDWLEDQAKAMEAA